MEFIALRDGGKHLGAHHRSLVINAVAQAQALLMGRHDGKPEQYCPGNRPSTFLLLERLDPASFGALVAFTFVNLSVFNHFWRREGRKHTWQEKLHYLVLPMVGAATVAVLWVNLEVTSLTLGLVWAGVGLVYLAYLTGRFRKPPPQFDAAKSERAWE